MYCSAGTVIHVCRNQMYSGIARLFGAEGAWGHVSLEGQTKMKD